MALVLALEPDARQASVLKQVVSDRLGSELVLVDSKDGALAAIAARVPDLILVTALLSPRDETDLTDHLRDLEGAEHLQTLTIPLLAGAVSPPKKKKKRGLLSALTGESDAPAAPSGCLPSVFADEVHNYLARAEELKVEAAAERERRGTRRRPHPRRGHASAASPGRDTGADAPASDTGSSNYWAWDPSPSETTAPATSPPGGGSPAAAHPAGHSTWDDPWGMSSRVHAEPMVASPPAAVNSDAPMGEAPVQRKETGDWVDQARAALEAAASTAMPVYVADHDLSASDSLPAPPGVDALDALLKQPATPTAGELIATSQPSKPSLEFDLSDLLGQSDAAPAAAIPDTTPVVLALGPGTDFHQVSQDGLDIAALLDTPPASAKPGPTPVTGAATDVAPAPGHVDVAVSETAVDAASPNVSPTADTPALDVAAEVERARAAREAAVAQATADHEAIDALRGDLERMRQEREAVERSLAEARDAQQKAESAAAEAASRATAEAEQRAQELAERVRKEAAADRRAREREEREAREEVERRAEIERLAREQAERLAKEVEARIRDEAATERRLREQADREAAAARAVEAARRSEREAAERQARLDAERRADEERQRRQQAEARIEAERKAREQVEKRAREQAERLAREAEERRVGEAAERKGRELAERQAREAERLAREAERQAREAERQAREAAEAESRLRSQRLVREAEERRAREAAQLKAREEAERRAREDAERRVEAERAARQEAERKARDEAARRAEAERRAVSDEALRQAREEAEHRAQEERKARLDAEHQARREGERRAAAERRAQEEGEKMAAEAARHAKEAAKAERRAREQAEKRAVEERKAREVAERRVREEATRRAAAEARARQEEERREKEQAARPSKRAAVVRRGKRRVEPEAPIARRGPADPDRPLQDEWGLFDPDKCGFGALYAKLEQIEDGAPPREEAPSAGDLVAGAGSAPTVNGRAPRPLSMWAWRDHAAVAMATGDTRRGPDDLRELVNGLAIAPAVAAMRYASGARIRRVTVPPPDGPVKGTKGEAQVIILSRKLLKAARQKSIATPRVTTRR